MTTYDFRSIAKQFRRLVEDADTMSDVLAKPTHLHIQVDTAHLHIPYEDSDHREALISDTEVGTYLKVTTDDPDVAYIHGVITHREVTEDAIELDVAVPTDVLGEVKHG